MEAPDYIEIVSENEWRLWKQIADFRNKFLRVVVNPAEKLLITAFFDRRFTL